MKHNGTLDELKTKITSCGFSISEEKQTQGGWQLRTESGAIVNWYTSTGTVQVQGKSPLKEKLETDLGEYCSGKRGDGGSNIISPIPEAPQNPASASKKVFVVHGHDSVSREQLELVLHKLGLDPFVLANGSGGGRTIIEALEAEIGPSKTAARFGIVLMTPDDVGYAKIDGAGKSEPRARQNVVLEMGMLISALGRANVAILKKGHLEVPSDANGILYIPFNEHVKEAVPRLADHLSKAGFVLSPENLTKATS